MKLKTQQTYHLDASNSYEVLYLRHEQNLVPDEMLGVVLCGGEFGGHLGGVRRVKAGRGTGVLPMIHFKTCQ